MSYRPNYVISANLVTMTYMHYMAYLLHAHDDNIGRPVMIVTINVLLYSCYTLTCVYYMYYI